MNKMREQFVRSTAHAPAISGALLFLLGGFLAPTAFADDNCRESRELSEELELDGISEISIDAGAGKLIVIGERGLTTAQVEARACATDEDDLEAFSLKTSKRGSTLALKTKIPKPSVRFMGSSYARLDLEIRVPAGYPVKITDTSGSMIIRGVASVEIEDGSGSIQIMDVPGAVEITDDGSGSITVMNAGSVRIGEDGSGSITATQIMNDVYVGRDGSGSISAKDVGGSFTVVSDSGGSIRHRNVAGVVQIDDD
ncbi:MAG: hypothetical protein AAFR07_02405 [Pseudomonadota bacterium]